MLYVFVPYYTENTKEFDESLSKQTVPYKIITRDRKRDKIYWTKSCNDFYKESFRWKGTNDSDVICIMNNDVIFDKDLFRLGMTVKQGEVLIPDASNVTINWKRKSFLLGYKSKTDSFIGRCFFMTLKDFKESGGFCKYLPHALADIDYGIKTVKKLKLQFIECQFIHPEHEMRVVSKFSLLSYENPILWTIFLIKNFNIYAPLNIIKSWLNLIR